MILLTEYLRTINGLPLEKVNYRVRQKFSYIQSLLLNIRHTSKKKYALYFSTDGCILVDTLENKILWLHDYFTPPICLTNRLEELLKFWKYEERVKNLNRIETNDYLTLKKKYIYGKEK